MIKFNSIGTFKVKGSSAIVFVELDRDCVDFSHLIGKTVEIDGQLERVLGVEAYCVSGHNAGEVIGLKLEKYDLGNPNDSV